MISPKVIGFIAEGERPDDTNRIGKIHTMLGRGGNVAPTQWVRYLRCVLDNVQFGGIKEDQYGLSVERTALWLFGTLILKVKQMEMEFMLPSLLL